MKRLIILLLFSGFAYAGPFEDRAQAFVDSLTGTNTPAVKVTQLLDSGLITYQAWLPTEIVDGVEQPQDPTTWTRERKAQFFIQSIRKEMRLRARPCGS